MALQSKRIYLKSLPVPAGIKTPRGFASIVQAIANYLAVLIPADLLTVIASFATPSSSRNDSLWLQLDANGNPIAINKFVSGTGWVGLSTKALASTTFPAITGSSPTDRAYAAGLFLFRTDLSQLYVYDNINNRWDAAGAYLKTQTVSGTYTIDAAGQVPASQLLCTGGPYVVTLPDASINLGRRIDIYTTATGGCNSGAAIAIQGHLNGVAGQSFSFQNPGKHISVVSDGSTWWITEFAFTSVIVSSNYTIDAAGQTPVNAVIASGGSYTINMPTPTGNAGRNITIYATTASGAAIVTIAGHLNGTPSATQTISTSTTRLDFLCDGTTWWFQPIA